MYESLESVTNHGQENESVKTMDWNEKFSQLDVPVLIAAQLVEFEDSILAENYVEGGAETRNLFINAMRSPRVDYTLISNFTNHLTRSLTSPPYVVVLKRLLEEKFGQHNLHNFGGGILWYILAYLYGDEQTIEINRSIFDDYMASHETGRPLMTLKSLCVQKEDCFQFVGEILVNGRSGQRFTHAESMAQI